MARSTHDKQMQRARDKRRQDALEKRRSRSRIIVLVLVALLALSLVGGALLSSRDGASPIVDDEPGASPDATDDPDGADDPDATDDEPGGDEAPGEGDEGDQAAAGERPEGACEPTPDDVPEVDSELYDDPPELSIDEDATYTATVATTCGDIVLELDAAGAPLTVNNFVFLAEEGYYDGVGFHRVIEGFVIQGGDPAGTGCGREDCTTATGDAFPGYTFEDELDTAESLVAEEGGYPQGSLAMANAGPDTNGSQFFIVEPDEGVGLPPSYTYFGQVLEGMDVVQAIARGPADGEGGAFDPVIITAVTVERS